MNSTGHDVVTNLMSNPSARQNPGAQFSYPHSPRGYPPYPITTKPPSPHPSHPHPSQALSPSNSMQALQKRKSTSFVSPPNSMLDAPTYKLNLAAGLLTGNGSTTSHAAGLLTGNGSTTSLSNQQGYLRSEHPSETSLISERGTRYR